MTRILFAKLPTICCIAGAAAVACTGHEGWGWFLLVALLLS